MSILNSFNFNPDDYKKHHVGSVTEEDMINEIHQQRESNKPNPLSIKPKLTIRQRNV